MNRAEAGRLGHEKAKGKLAEYNAIRTREAIERWLGSNCKKCGRPLTYEERRNKYCTHTCAAQVNNAVRAANGGIVRRDSRPPVNCIQCNTAIRLPKKNQILCSKQCVLDRSKARHLNAWLSGNHPGGSWAGVSTFVRTWLIQTLGDKCSKCGWCEVNPTSKKVPIQVEHIDGDPYNHRPENLTLLCPNCHSLTPTFGGLNRGNGRSERYRQRGSLGGALPR